MANRLRLVTCIIEPRPSRALSWQLPARLVNERGEMIILACCEVEEHGAKQFRYRVVVVEGPIHPRHAPEVPS